MDAMAEALSALRWWRDAGVDVLVEDVARDWLRAPPPRSAPEPQRPAAPAAPIGSFPDTLAGMAAWYADPANLADLGSDRLAAAGDPASGLMILVDMPEAQDQAGGPLMSGPCGRLFDAILAAIGRDRASIYLAAMCPARPPAGRIEPALAGSVVAAARHHVGLAAPRVLLLMGREAVQAFGLPWPGARGRLHEINHDGRKVAAVATFHPRMLPQSPARKADLWADLRVLLEELDR
jgi:DNA polymerase